MWLMLVVYDVLFFFSLFFFFQAEDGIRDVAVTGVQTCALPIWGLLCESAQHILGKRVGLDLMF